MSGDVAELRQLLCETQALRRHEPTGDQRVWERAEAHIADGQQADAKEEQPCG
ncbi:hypothetical protein [Streptomyces sp. NPDC059909]|uniref:hypothetical protein n=1 Tax=Streptomyces sp. NPDC059909 TaxID=3346998 RepID=UPI0036476606